MRMPRLLLPLAVLAVGGALAAGSQALAAGDTAEGAAPRTAAVEPDSTGDRAVFVPVAPVRLADSRKTSPLPAKGSRAVQVSGVGGVPADAVAVVVNVTAIGATRAGYLLAYPAGAAKPPYSNLHYGVGQTVANLATVKMGTGGKISVYNGSAGTTHFVVDLAGYYRGHAHDDRYLLKAEAQGRTAANAFDCPGGTVLRAVAKDGAPTCVTDSDTTYSAGPGLLLDNGVFTAEQRRSAPNAFTCPAGQYLRSVAADGTPTCAVDVDTDTDTNTTYTAGPGLLLDNGVFTAEQRRSAPNAFTCPAGQYLRSVAADGTPTCAVDVDTDTNTPYSAGFGLLLTNGVFSAEQGRSAPNAFTCATGSYIRSVAADGTPTCAADIDTDTTYSAGFGVLLDNGVFSAEQGRSAKNAFTCDEGWYLQAVAEDGAPTCAQDVDTDTDTNTTYTAGFGLLLTNGVFSAEQGRSATNAFTCPSGQFLRSVAANGAPTCGADANTTYLAGFGLNLNGNVLSAQQARTALSSFNCPPGQALRIVANDGAPTCIGVPVYTGGNGISVDGGVVSLAQGTTVVPVRGDSDPVTNGTALRSALNAISGATAQKPYVLSLAAGTFDLGTGSGLTLPQHVSLVGAGRGITTIRGNYPSQSGGLVNLNVGTTVAALSVTNAVTGTTSWSIGIMANGAGAPRLVDVAATASGAAESFGLLVFNGAQVTVDRGTYVGSNGALGTGIYAILNASVLARGVEAVSSAPSGFSLRVENSATVVFEQGFLNGHAKRMTPDSTVKIGHSRLDGGSAGGVQCFGVHDTAWNAVTCA